MRVLVTGGSGFIGSVLVRELRNRGDAVTVIDSRGAHPDPRARSVVGDIRDPAARVEAFREPPDAVAHLAARTSVLGSLQAPEETFEVNTAATAALLEAARRAGTGTFLLASTNAVVGAGAAAGELISERSRLAPLTPYGASKAAAEMELHGYAAAYGLRGVALRFTNVYGPGMLAAGKDSIVPRMLRAAAAGEPIDVYGDGRQVRDYVHVADAVRAMLAALDGAFDGPLVLGAGRSVSVLELVELAGQAAGRPLHTRHVPAKAGEMRAVQVDIARARELGVAPRIELLDGLREVWAADR